jgi:RNA-directed DNA polymerase
MGKHPEIKGDTAKLLKAQRGKCPECGLYFRDGDLMEIDHIKPKSQGGGNGMENKQLLHQHCHDNKTTKDGVNSGMNDNHQLIEEPCEVNVSSTVLKTSNSGDRIT